MKPLKTPIRNEVKGSSPILVAGLYAARVSLIFCLSISTALAGAGGVSGGNVTVGSVRISGEGTSSVDIEQSSRNAVIHWDSFDTVNGDLVRFRQPDASSVAVNIIGSGRATQFDGALDANGHVVIVNNNGVVFGATATVNVSGLTATTSDFDEDTFSKDGTMNFTAPRSPDSGAVISNEGTITVNDAGLLAFVAPNVRNTGTIQADLGQVHLASGDSFTLDLAGDGLINLAVSDDVTDQLIDHQGQISANGGKVQITAATGKNIVNNIINMGGLTQAQTVGRSNGKIIIRAGVAPSAGKNLPQEVSKDATSQINIKGHLEAGTDGGGGVVVGGGGTLEFDPALVIEGNDINITDNAVLTASQMSFRSFGSRSSGVTIDGLATFDFLSDPNAAMLLGSESNIKATTKTGAFDSLPNIFIFTQDERNVELDGLRIDQTISGCAYGDVCALEVLGTGGRAMFVNDGSVTPPTYYTIDVTINPLSRTYGDSNPGAVSYVYSGFVNGDDASILSGSPVFLINGTATQNAAAGSQHSVTLSQGSLSSSKNYYQFNFVNGTLSITPAVLTITADAKTKVYGDANPALTASYSGFKNNETSAVVSGLNLTSAATQTSSVGNYNITGSGGSASNYTIQYVTGNMAVTRADLTITADGKTRVYGDANPALTASYSGLKNSDTSAVVSGLSLATGATQASNVGNYTITASGGSAGNYNITYVSGNLAVTPAALTITADAKTKIYGDSNPALTASYSGLKNSDTSTVVSGLSLATGATTSSGVGSYAITASGGSASNYTITHVNGSLAITPAALTITTDNQSKVYGDLNPALTASYSGFKNSDTSAVVSGLSVTTAATQSSGVGSYGIAGSGASASNYTISYVNGTLSVTPAALTITADNQSRVYGDTNPTLTASYSGFKNGDTASSLSGLALNTSATQGSNVGSYNIVASGASNSNYTISYVNGSLAITPASLTITAQNKSKVYGDANPALTAAYSGFKNSDTASSLSGLVLGTNAVLGSGVGSYNITASGATNTNYNISFVNGAMVITPASLTVTAQNKSKVFGDANPALTASYSGFKNGDDSSVLSGLQLATLADSSSVVGSYDITASGATNANYNIIFVNGALNVLASDPVTPPVVVPPPTKPFVLPTTVQTSAQQVQLPTAALTAADIIEPNKAYAPVENKVEVYTRDGNTAVMDDVDQSYSDTAGQERRRDRDEQI